jgi:hypothetical protein
MSMSKVIPIMGPGCGNPELEKCPPSSHFELNKEELFQAIQDLDIVAKRLGLEPGSITSIQITVPQGQSHASADSPVIYCCIKCTPNGVCCQPWPQ